jgi:glutamate synthase (NADPH/NADH) small chain
VFRVSSAHEEGGNRRFAVSTTGFTGDADGQVRLLHGHKVTRAVVDGRAVFATEPGTAFDLPADLVLLAMGFTGPAKARLLDDLELRMTDRGTVWRDEGWMTSSAGIFAAGDMQRGQSLIVWAIADGRQAAAAIDRYVMRA